MSGILIFLFPEENERLNRMGKEKQPKTKAATKHSNRKFINASISRLRTTPVVSQLSKGNVLVFSNKDVNKTHGTATRDHCMETDFCILRRYCKTRNYKSTRRFLNKKYSINKLLVSDTFEKSKTDNSACGDLKQTNGDIIENIGDINANLTDLVIRNLNKLLRDWIKNYLFNNEETKNKIQMVLDSMLRKLEANTNASSCSTYTIDIRIRDSSSKTTNAESDSIMLLNCRRKPDVAKDEVALPKFKTYSSVTVPFAEKHFSIISTLSIPRYFNACHHQTAGRTLRSLNKMNKAHNKNVLLTISKSNKLLSNSSSLELLAISAKSLTKHFATYRDHAMVKRDEKKRRIVFIPSSYYKFPESTSVTNLNEELISTKQINIDPMPSLVKSIFTDEISNIESDCLENLNDKDTMTAEQYLKEGMKLLSEIATSMSPHMTINTAAGNDDLSSQPVPDVEIKQPLSSENPSENKDDNEMTCKGCFKTHGQGGESDPLSTIDFSGQNNANGPNEKPDEKHPSASSDIKPSLLKKMFATKRKKKCCFKNENFENIRHKHISYEHKKSDNNLNNEFLEHIQDMFNYFANYKGKRNINLDIRINVYPTLEGDDENENKCKQRCSSCNDTSSSQMKIVDDKSKVTEESSVEREKSNMQITHFCNCQPKLNTKYDSTLKTGTEDRVKNLETVDRTKYLNNEITTIADLDIAQEVIQLRAIIKDLTTTAEKFVQDHLNNSRKCNIGEPSNKTVLFSTNIERIPKESSAKGIEVDIKNSVTKSKGTQCSNNLSCQKLSCTKIKIETNKNDTNEIHNRLTKKSTSYNVIESETLLKVTDMTSAVQTSQIKAVTDEALTCSLPKCRSLYDISVESNKNKLVAFYCDEFLRNQETNSSGNIRRPHCPVQTQISKICPMNHPIVFSNTQGNEEKRSKSKGVHCPQCLSEKTNSCEINDLSSSVLITIDGKPIKKKTFHTRRVIGFREGSLYCLLLLIPLFIILWLLYIYIIKDKLKPKVCTSNQSSKLFIHDNNGSRINITLSDLGF